MADLFNGKSHVGLDEQYNRDYECLTSGKNELKIADVYFICLIMGYRNNAKIISKNQKGKEFRPSYFTSLQRNLLCGLILNLPGITPEDIVDDTKINLIFENLTEYANGGLQWIREHVFGDVLNDRGEIDVDSETVIVRLNEMIHDEINPEKAPF